MNFIDKFERKFPRFGITHLMKYVIIVNVIGAVLGILDSSGVFGVPIYSSYLSLDYYQIFNGQVWRLITWVLYPVYDFSGTGMMVNLLWFALWAYVYYFLGTQLERLWGKVRFNLFYFGGVIFVMLSTLVFYLINVNMGIMAGADVWYGFYIGMAVTLEYLNETLFLAYALMNPNAQFLMYFLVPVKAKWLAVVSFVLMGYHLVVAVSRGAYYVVALIVGALLNMGIFFLFGRGKGNMRGQFEQHKRRAEFEKKVKSDNRRFSEFEKRGMSQFGHRARPHESGAPTNGARHKCAICGRTELDAPNLEFRFCSKCNGNYEYCSDHLFSHEHVR